MSIEQRLQTIWFTLAIGVSVLLLALGGARLIDADGSGTGYDPLSSAEVASIARIATKHELLLVERHAEPKATTERGSWRRRADVYLYDYATDTLTIALVDVESGMIEAVEHTQQVQLPLTHREVERAIDLINGDGAVQAAISAELSGITGQSLDSLRDDVQIKAFTFVAAALPRRVNAASEACGVQRCAQLLLYTTDNIALDLMPIVNLSTGEIVQLMGVVADAPHLHMGGDPHEH